MVPRQLRRLDPFGQLWRPFQPVSANSRIRLFEMPSVRP